MNENSESFNFGYLNGVRGFYTNPSRADDCFIPFKSIGELVNTFIGTNTIGSNLEEGVYLVHLTGLSEGTGYGSISISNSSTPLYLDTFVVSKKPNGGAFSSGEQTNIYGVLYGSGNITIPPVTQYGHMNLWSGELYKISL